MSWPDEPDRQGGAAAPPRSRFTQLGYHDIQFAELDEHNCFEFVLRGRSWGD